MEEKRQLDLFPFFLFLTFSLYSCAATRLSQEVITVSLLFNCKIFLQFHPVSEISEKGNKRVYFPFLSFFGIRSNSIRPVFLVITGNLPLFSMPRLITPLLQFSPRLPDFGKKGKTDFSVKFDFLRIFPVFRKRAKWSK